MWQCTSCGDFNLVYLLIISKSVRMSLYVYLDFRMKKNVEFNYSMIVWISISQTMRIVQIATTKKGKGQHFCKCLLNLSECTICQMTTESDYRVYAEGIMLLVTMKLLSQETNLLMVSVCADGSAVKSTKYCILILKKQ